MILKLDGNIGSKTPESSVNSSKRKNFKLGDAARISIKEKLSLICTLLKPDISSEK